MNLDAIPAGVSVMLDANVAIYAKRGTSPQCQRLLARCATREIEGVITTLAVAEFCHRRMMQEAQGRGLVSSNPARALSQSPELLKQLTQYAADVEDLLAGDLTVLPIAGADFPQALSLQHLHGLLTNDSLQLAAGARAAVSHWATLDQQFARVPGILVYQPDDLAV